MDVLIVGTGYVGLTTGVCLAYLGHNVSCLDTNESKIAAFESGKVPFHEPYLGELLQETREKLHFTTDFAEAVPKAQVIFIAVGTPTASDGAPDLQYLQTAARSIGENLGSRFTVIVNKSTVPIGCGNWVELLVDEAYERKHGRKSDEAFAIASNPEFLREGSAIFDTLYPDRIVVGSNQRRAASVLCSLYRSLLEQEFLPPKWFPRPQRMGVVPLITTDLASAELIKYAANAFLALKISYINEIGQLAEKVGADIDQIAVGMGLDARIGKRFLQAGVGWGGSCFGKDTAALISTAEEYGLNASIVKATRSVNERQRERVVEKLLAELKILKGRTVGVLGLSFKTNTDDLRESPAVDIAQRLIERGVRVKAHDPVSIANFKYQNPNSEVICCARAENVVCGSDAVVLMTEWPEYLDLDWPGLQSAMKTPLLLDCRSHLDRASLIGAGYRYQRLAG